MTQKKANRNSAKLWIKFRDGRFEIPGVDTWHTYWQEPYYLLLTIPWMGFLLLMALFYVAVNTAFAFAYLLGGDCIENATSGSFSDAFFFSVQTLSSIGYGNMYPTTTFADTLVTTEALIGTLGIALLTGLAFTKFSQPTARVVFSRAATIYNHDGVSTLMLRTANQRRNQIIEAEIRVYLMRDEISIEGEYMRRFYLLKLLHNRTPSFTLSWTVMHQIDEHSPLWQATPESLTKTRAMLIVSLSGIDKTVDRALHASYSYAASDIFWQHRFADIFHHTPQGSRYIDYTHFHDVISVESDRNG
ncbi:ion channel [Myxosarcina sp. GI1]|uniref:ion channel n=1 Tax=Myxosarcina sp. GI1 TaxID=1541065 RepID=UPI00055EF18A|nr:ion channel [Myxosarcina sp. GI1]